MTSGVSVISIAISHRADTHRAIEQINKIMSYNFFIFYSVQKYHYKRHSMAHRYGLNGNQYP